LKTKLGVTKLVPVAMALPPVAAVYQLIVPESDADVRVTLPAPHLLAEPANVMTGTGMYV